jgi:hypothetical protein
VTTATSPWEMKATTALTGDFEVIEAGAHLAVMIALIDLGTHTEEFTEKKEGPNKGKKTWKDYRKVYFVWELTEYPNSKKPGHNHYLGLEFNLSFTDKSGLRKFVETWRGARFKDGEGFDIGKLIGQPCQVVSSVSQSKSNPEKSYAKIETVIALRKGQTAPAPKQKPRAYALVDADELDAARDWLPRIFGEEVADVILRSKEIKGDSKPADTAGATMPGRPAATDPAPVDAAGEPAF